MKNFSICNICVSYSGKEVLHDISCDIPAGTVTAIMGGNACGKTTLLKSMAGLLKPSRGTCFFDGKPLKKLSGIEIAKKIAFCAQNHPDCGYLTVSELVMMGRYPYRELRQKSIPAIEKAMKLAEIECYADRKIAELSAGICQRAFIALALAREPELLLLDEPTNFLDPAKRCSLLHLLNKLKQENNMTTVIATHDFELALNVADRIIFLKDGKCISGGCPPDGVTGELLFETYGIRGSIIKSPSGTRAFIPALEAQSPNGVSEFAGGK